MSLGYYYSLLAKKQSDLQRLLACEGELQGKQQEFNHYRHTVTKPDLSPFTWQESWQMNLRISGLNKCLRVTLTLSQISFKMCFQP